jgi:hypothetical protein
LSKKTGVAELEYEIKKIKTSNFAALLLCAFARNLIHTAIMQRQKQIVINHLNFPKKSPT